MIQRERKVWRDDLREFVVYFFECRPQGFMAPNDQSESLFENLRTERTSNANRGGHVKRRGVAIELRQKPKALLGRAGGHRVKFSRFFRGASFAGEGRRWIREHKFREAFFRILRNLLE